MTLTSTFFCNFTEEPVVRLSFVQLVHTSGVADNHKLQ